MRFLLQVSTRSDRFTPDPRRTQHVPVLCEESGIGPKVDSTADNVQRPKLGAICLARRGIAKDLSVVAVIGIRVRLPARYPAEDHLGPRESKANHPSIFAL